MIDAFRSTTSSSSLVCPFGQKTTVKNVRNRCIFRPMHYRQFPCTASINAKTLFQAAVSQNGCIYMRRPMLLFRWKRYYTVWIEANLVCTQRRNKPRVRRGLTTATAVSCYDVQWYGVTERAALQQWFPLPEHTIQTACSVVYGMFILHI